MTDPAVPARVWLRRWFDRLKDAGGRTGADDENAPLLEARGTGGRLVLWDDHIRLIKDSVFGSFINLLGLGYGSLEKVIIIEDISAISIVRPMLFPNFISITYPGCPPSTGNPIKDGLAENALLMNFVDNRRFDELKARVDLLRRQRRRLPTAP